jgi:hypothetical protein
MKEHDARQSPEEPAPAVSAGEQGTEPPLPASDWQGYSPDTLAALLDGLPPAVW